MDKMKEILEMADREKLHDMVRTLKTGSTVIAGVALAVALFTVWFVVKYFRVLNSAQKTLPVLRRAAQLYIDQNDDGLDYDEDELAF